MVTLKQITSAQTDDFAYVEGLLTTSFPLEEYRPLKEWKDFTDNNPLFRNNIIYDNDKRVGLMTIWDFDNFYYIEHFAVDASLRNGGYGSKTLTLLEKLIDKPIILEVEIPDNNTAIRRYKFYKRYQFTAWENHNYVQPPYRESDSDLPMVIMCRGTLEEDKDYDMVVKKIYKEVYNRV